MNNKFSITSNEVKLFKHLSNLQDIQNGKARPVMVHISPTNKCNRNCSHCCFSGRDKKISIDFELLKSALSQFKKLGVKAFELTGGGEPTLYEHTNEVMEFASDLGFKIGMNTNACDVSRITDWTKFEWVRVASNAFDDKSKQVVERYKRNVALIQPHTKVTSCYVVPQDIGLVNIHKVVKFANEFKVHTRIAPDCIQTRECIKEQTDSIIEELKRYPENEYCFCSDFNVYLFDRPDNVCMLHMLKPFLYTDGWIYACPSSELALENRGVMREQYRVCRAEDVYDYYTNKFEIFHHGCSYCKYAKQNEILNALLVETDNNEFC